MVQPLVWKQVNLEFPAKSWRRLRFSQHLREGIPESGNRIGESPEAGLLFWYGFHPHLVYEGETEKMIEEIVVNMSVWEKKGTEKERDMLTIWSVLDKNYQWAMKSNCQLLLKSSVLILCMFFVAYKQRNQRFMHKILHDYECNICFIWQCLQLMCSWNLLAMLPS